MNSALPEHRERLLNALESELDEHSIVALVSTNTGMNQRHIHTAIDYWSSYPKEVDSRISQAELAEVEAAAELGYGARRRRITRASS